MICPEGVDGCKCTLFREKLKIEYIRVVPTQNGEYWNDWYEFKVVSTGKRFKVPYKVWCFLYDHLTEE